MNDQIAPNSQPFEALLAQAITSPIFADEGKPASALFQTIEAVNLDLALNDTTAPNEKLAKLAQQVSVLAAYLKSTRYLEHHADALRVSRSNLGAACGLLKAHENNESAHRTGYLSALEELMRAGRDLEPLLGEEYLRTLSKLRKPQREDLGAPGLDDHELALFSWRYDEARSMRTFNDCVQQLLKGFGQEPPACIQQRNGVFWWLTNAAGKIIVEKELLRLWANGRNVMDELEQLERQAAELLAPN